MQVYAVIDRDADGIADDVVTVVSNLPAPLGLAYANGSLWVATTPTIYRFDNVDELALSGRVSTSACSMCTSASPVAYRLTVAAIKVCNVDNAVTTKGYAFQLCALLQNFSTPTIILPDLGLPSDHGNHYMTIGPDNMIYFNLGAPFNIGSPVPAVGTRDLNFATIARMSSDGKNISTFATGTSSVSSRIQHKLASLRQPMTKPTKGHCVVLEHSIARHRI